VSAPSAWKDELATAGVEAAGGLSEERLREIEAILRRTLPSDLRILLAAADGLFSRGGQWWVIWPSDRVVEENLRTWNAGQLDSDLIAFGDDGTGNPFCITSDNEVIYWSWIDVAIERSMGRLPDLLVEWVQSRTWPPPASPDQ